MVTPRPLSTQASTGVQLSTADQHLGASITAEETVYTTLDDNLLQVQVSVNVDQSSQGAAEGVPAEIHHVRPPTGVSETGQMWSVGAGGGQESGQSGGLGLMLSGESEGEAGGSDDVHKTELISGAVQEEVELLGNQEQ